jgi:hypothetical protein
MEDNLILEENGFELPKRSQFLTILCVLSFVMCGLKLLTSIYSVYQNSPAAMQKSIEQVRQIKPEMADQMENNMIEMQNNTYLKLSPYFEIIYTLLSFLAVLMMWNLKKNGFFLYSIVEIIPYISLFFVSSKSISIPGLSASSASSIMVFGTLVMILIDLVFVYLYFRNLKEMNK